MTNGYSLALNAGSSSLKFSVYSQAEDEGWRLESRGEIGGIASSPRIFARNGGGQTLVDRDLDGEVSDAHDAIHVLAAWLKAKYEGSHVAGVGHRVVHGGTRFSGPVLITDKVISEIQSLAPLAPLHQPNNLAAIIAAQQRLRDVPQVACFDTSFHRGQPAVAQVIPLPREIRSRGVQRYGFHGLSYEYVASALPQVAPEIAKGRVIVAHLGSGASMCALRDGKSIDCTLGFTALDGLCMGTRPGSLDPGVILYLFQTLGLSAREVEAMLYKESGLLGLSEISSDMRELLRSDAPAARLAVEYFVYRAAKELGALAATLGGVDGLVFTAGIGENSAEIRKRICDASAWLGIELDEEANGRHRTKISTKQSKISVWIIPTNEELVITRHTGSLLGLSVHV